MSDGWKRGSAIPTASQFSRIVTATGALSKQRDSYLAELLAEWCLGEPVKEFLGTDATDAATRWNRKRESTTLSSATWILKPWGLIYEDERRMVGCSPDA